eukprot:m.419574 g.419574  ORF g.419574 m.419574 type:complete len:86 (+) comp56627_c0_seq55:2457-2714(+)
MCACASSRGLVQWLVEWMRELCLDLLLWICQYFGLLFRYLVWSGVVSLLSFVLLHLGTHGFCCIWARTGSVAAIWVVFSLVVAED